MRIDELRDTLQEHADLSYDEGLAGRADAVRGRVRGVRRRRAGVVAAVAVAAVAAVPVLEALEIDGPEPAGRDLAGRTAPETFVANGYTYEFERGVEGSAGEPLDLRLPKSDEPRLVSWTVNDGDADGRLIDRQGDQYYRDWVAGGTGFETYEYVAPDSSARYRLTSTAVGEFTGSDDAGEMAMAVYTLSDQVPEGVSGQGVVFRDSVDGAELLGAGIGEPGEASVSFDIELPEGMLRLSELCTADRQDYMVHVEVEGQRGWSGTSCAGEAERDAGGGGWYGFELAGRKKEDGSRFRVGETVEVTASIHPDERGRTEPVEVPGAFVGLGAYADEPGEPIGATEETLDRLVEAAGHSWTLTDLDVSTPGAGGHTVRIGPVREQTYVEFGAANDPPGRGDGANLRWRTSIDGERIGRAYQGDSGSYGPAVDIRLAKGDSMEIEMEAISGVDEYLSFYVASYTLAD